MTLRARWRVATAHWHKQFFLEIEEVLTSRLFVSLQNSPGTQQITTFSDVSLKAYYLTVLA